MNRLLHIIATPRGKESRTLKVSEEFLGVLGEKTPGCLIDELNVWSENLPALTLSAIDSKYALLSAGDVTEELKNKKAWKGIEAHIDRFLSADAYLISTPMWNFNIPYSLKHYIDILVQPKYLFRYTDKGVEGLVKGKKMVVITSRGGDYSAGSSFHSYDLQEPYLKAVFGFVGITDITFLNVQPMDALGDGVQKEKIEEAKAQAREIAESFLTTASEEVSKEGKKR